MQGKPSCKNPLRVVLRSVGGERNSRQRALRVTLKGQEKEISALTYKMNATFYAPPSQEYLAIIREGYRDFGLDQNFLIQAFEESI